MKRLVSRLGIVLAALLAACAAEQVTLPTPAPEDVPLRVVIVASPSYARDIRPIFDDFCVGCHGPALAENGLRLDSYDGVMQGTQFGPVVVPYQSFASTLVYVLEHPLSPQVAMPREGHRLSPNRIKNIIYWIDAGARND